MGPRIDLARYGVLALLVQLLLLAAPVRAQPARPLVWALGDSRTAGYGLPPAQGFTAQLQAALRRAAKSPAPFRPQGRPSPGSGPA